MKKEIASLFSNLFGAKKDHNLAAERTSEVIITSYSQPHVLQQRMQAEELTHGETVAANLSPVRLENHMGKMVMYFCPMKNIEVLQTITDGDGGSIPSEAIVQNLTIPANFKSGFYNLNNVILTSNGTMQVKATGKTTWENARSEF
jgi:hypothetical protein